jgi:hypothetical protein
MTFEKRYDCNPMKNHIYEEKEHSTDKIPNPNLQSLIITNLNT